MFWAKVIRCGDREREGKVSVVIVEDVFFLVLAYYFSLTN